MLPRIIVKLDVKPPFVVKPIHFEGLRKIGDPLNLSKKYYNQGADEIAYIDIVASLYQRKIIFEDIKKTSRDLFIPFSVGGGIRSIDDCYKLFNMGADKVIINTFALQKDPTIIDKAARVFGSQSVVVNIESKYIDKQFECFSDCGRIRSNKNTLVWAKEVQERGAGEIFLQSVDHDGKKNGFNIQLSYDVVNSLDIPVIVSSGAGCLDHIEDLIRYVKPSGISVSSVLHYDNIEIKDIRKKLREIYNNE